eukprot:scaffold101947_cov63-Phaeocystis_antarctica.AAC.2
MCRGGLDIYVSPYTRVDANTVPTLAQAPFGGHVEVGDALFVHMEAPDHTSLLRRAYDARGRAILENEWLEGR